MQREVKWEKNTPAFFDIFSSIMIHSHVEELTSLQGG
jgi:hypothetical protein